MRWLALRLVVASLMLGGCAQGRAAGRQASREPIVGLPCEGCEAIFDGLPSTLTSQARIAPADEPGEPMRIEGTVTTPGGRAAAGVIVYAYHTDAHGTYPEDETASGEAARRHGRLRGWAVTDEQGHYRFDTIRPASYPDKTTPAHIHMHVLEIGRCTYYIDSIHFEDDPRLAPTERETMSRARGGSGLVRPVRADDGTWIVTRDIHLGENVPGYPAWP